MKSCCFTGHRALYYTDNLDYRLRETIIYLIKQGVTEFYAGGAIGWDTLCAEMVINIRDNGYPDIHLNLILPCKEKEQTAKWDSEAKRRFRQVYESADNIEILSENYHRDCMKNRNQRMVDLSDWCVCYCDERKSMGGTAQTVRMAQKKGIKIINLY